jgi:Zn ribbon nucleic-acid-binding protein
MIQKIWYKSCPKCHGDLALEQDYTGNFRVCIQCGFSQELVVKRQPMEVTRRVPVAAEAA